MVALDVFGAGEVGDGAGDFEDAVVGAGGEVHLLHGLFEVDLGFGIERAVFADLFRAHRGVGVDAFAGGEAEALDVAGFGDAGADGGGGFSGVFFGGELTEIDGRNVDVEIDPV